MTPRELNRLIEPALTTALLLGMSACGGTGTSDDQRLIPSENPIVSEQHHDSARDPNCGEALWWTVTNDPNAHQSPIDLVTVRAIRDTSLDPLQGLPPPHPGEAQCGQLCGGADRFVSAEVRLTTGEWIQVGARVKVRDCEVDLKAHPFQATCFETWSWDLLCAL